MNIVDAVDIYGHPITIDFEKMTIAEIDILIYGRPLTGEESLLIKSSGADPLLVVKYGPLYRLLRTQRAHSPLQWAPQFG
ncbi:hypothetical protein F0L74_09795 [Chitinophaga agrisoli]|uniref:Uncharacterized protein n=1 Tax=Chitinophaga agrisoli TaxID=2607653 RepID=A0A5B2VUA8_9BACT|nr:hypothetical protein [Chitinophaga agrisoli]KAA2242811.1 hypothetical protein F0L74_09795 [Chitinophaga agrisoli]